MNHLAIFARPPVPGQVKTRLTPALSAALAAELYAALLADTLEAGRGCAAGARSLWWADAPVAGVASAGYREYRQSGEGLGERLADAAATLWRAPGDRVVLVGSDAPALEAAHLDDAFAALESHDVVLGPSTDGGYWLVGLARPAPELFVGIAWSTARVLAQTRAAAARAGLRVGTLATLDDLDTPDDLARLVAAAAAGEPARFGPHATALLRRLGRLPG